MPLSTILQGLKNNAFNEGETLKSKEGIKFTLTADSLVVVFPDGERRTYTRPSVLFARLITPSACIHSE